MGYTKSKKDTEFTLYRHQQELVDLAPKKYLLHHECGTGKSLTAIKLCDKLCKTVLVICPKSIKDQWIENIKELSDNPEGYKVLTKEEFKKQHKDLETMQGIIWDEIHYAANYKSQIHKATMAYIKRVKPECIYGLTATVYLSSAWNIYSVAHILGHDWNWMKFKREFFFDIKMGSKTIPKQREGIEPKIAILVNELGNTVRMDECVDIPEQVFETETFDLTPSQKKAIKEVKETEVNHIVRWTKTHQICGGSLKGDGYTKDQFFKNEKIARLKDLASAHKKLVVVCRYNNEIDYIVDELGMDYEILKIRGSTKDRHRVVEAANDFDECIVLVNAACSEGYELPTFPLMIFYSYDFSLKNYLQMIGRIQRINKIKKNVYLSLIVKGTIDEDVFNCIKRKKDFDVAIYNK